jgi:hypothetical protein
MTALPEAKLAREAEICYAIIACITDYDCWHETQESVTAEIILETLRRNIGLAKRIIKLALGRSAWPSASSSWRWAGYRRRGTAIALRRSGQPSSPRPG